MCNLAVSNDFLVVEFYRREPGSVALAAATLSFVYRCEIHVVFFSPFEMIRYTHLKYRYYVSLQRNIDEVKYSLRVSHSHYDSPANLRKTNLRRTAPSIPIVSRRSSFCIHSSLVSPVERFHSRTINLILSLSLSCSSVYVCQELVHGGIYEATNYRWRLQRAISRI